MLPSKEAVAEFEAVTSLYGRASVLMSAAARLQPLNPSVAVATLREALRSAWPAGRSAIMRVVAQWPVALLGGELPASIARWIPEVDAWWTEDDAEGGA